MAIQRALRFQHQNYYSWMPDSEYSEQFIGTGFKCVKLASFGQVGTYFMVELSLELFLVLFTVAFAAGFISSIAGAGGMVVLPVLLWTGMPVLNALATNKFQSVFGTLSSTINFFRKGHIDFKALKLALLCAFVGALIGTLVVQSINAGFLKAIIPYALILIALYMLVSPKISDQDSEPKLTKLPFDMAVGGGLGFYGGVFGPGMGSFYAAAFAGLRGYSMPKATAYAKPMVLITNFTSMVVFIYAGQVVWLLAIPMACAQVLGARVGSNLVISRGTRLIKPVIITATVLIALKMIVWP